MPFRSRRQWAWAFATNQPFARRWAHETPGGEGARFRRLPETKADAAPPTGSKPADSGRGSRPSASNTPPPAKPAPTAGAPRKKMTPSEVARHAALVRWKKKNPLMGRVLELREKRKGGGGGGGAKPKAAKPTPEEKQAKKEQEQAENRAKTFEALGLFEDATAALDALRKGEAVEDDGGLVKLGLAEQAADGSYRLTAAGRALHSAASRGDVGAARDTLSKAKDRAEASAGGAAEKEEKPKGGGGGGGGKEEEKKPEEGEDDAKKQERAEAAAETGGKVGLAPEDVDALRSAAEAGGVDNARLRDLGLVGEDGTTTDQGRRALSALERGDVRGYRAALQDVEAARGRAKGKADRDAERERAKGEREKEREARTQEREKAKADREEERQAKEREREQAKRDKEDQELSDLADDFRRGRRGLSFAEQRRLIRAGRARLNGEKFELKARALALELDLLELDT